ncbi:hypothetical protein, partial [Falsiroseomonas frigidaquae]|uniref:hypothetical protein n=1 Tax=Falsiroseomonas frigidaquae TaxID=487318 RepID=UPI001ADFE67A
RSVAPPVDCRWTPGTRYRVHLRHAGARIRVQVPGHIVVEFGDDVEVVVARRIAPCISGSAVRSK